MNLDRGIEQTSSKLEKIEEGLRYLIDLNLLDAFYYEVWRKDTIKLLDKYKDKSSFYDLPLEKTDSTIQQVVEWFGEDHGLALINDEFWMVSVGSIDEGGNKWWFKIKINTDDRETARKVILLNKLLIGSVKQVHACHR